MKNVKFTKPFRRFTVGEVKRFADNTANVLVKLGVASYDVDKVETPLHEEVKAPVEVEAEAENSELEDDVEEPKKKRGRPPKSDNTYETKVMKADE